MAAHRQPAYAGHPHGPLPVTEALTDNTLILPVFHQMTETEQDRVIDAVSCRADGSRCEPRAAPRRRVRAGPRSDRGRRRWLMRYEVIGIVDDDPTRAGDTIGGVAGPRRPGRAGPTIRDADVVVCAGKGSARRSSVDRLSAAGFAGSPLRDGRAPVGAAARLRARWVAAALCWPAAC